MTLTARAAAILADDLLARPATPEGLAILVAHDELGIAGRVQSRYMEAVGAMRARSALCDLRDVLNPYDISSLFSLRRDDAPEIVAAIAQAERNVAYAWAAYREELVRVREVADRILASVPGAAQIVIDNAIA